MNFSESIKAFFEALKAFFGWREALSENKTANEIIEDKKDLEKACVYADRAITLVFKHASFPRSFTKMRFESLVKKFRKLR